MKSGNVDVEVDGGGFGCFGADVSGNEAGCGDASECEVGIEFAYEGEGSGASPPSKRVPELYDGAIVASSQTMAGYVQTRGARRMDIAASVTV